MADVSEDAARQLSVYSVVQVYRGVEAQPRETSRIISRREFESMLAMFPQPALDQKRYRIADHNRAGDRI